MRRLPLALAMALCHAAPARALEIAPGPFEGNLESLRQYRCPEWFRDAKFGIWAHWGPQAVPMEGDWYAKHMYVQGHRQYEHHLATYGHPSEHGYKEIIALWKAERWDPDRLMELYKRAGARYFVSMGSHHDNFYLWNSKLHRWNSMNMGPRRDVVGEWQRAARRHGLRFGVSEHLGASFTWFQPSHGSDKEGPKAGVPYDGADPQYEDLYHFPAEPGDTGWYSNNPRWQQQWFERIKELVDAYHPDLLYTDGGVPFGNEVGASLIAHLYNADAARRGGAVDVVYTCKQRSEGRWVEDLERGVMPKINPDPWQTDTSIGDWYYNRNWQFRPASWTIHMLVDIVSKNGNLLLNVVQRPDGSLDPEAEATLEQMAEWIATHGEAIYGTRPWLVYGEGGVRYRGGSFGEDFGYSAADIRFTTKDGTLYAIALGWPSDGRLLVRSLASAAGRVKAVSLLGHAGAVEWCQTDEGLTVTVPERPVSPYTCALRVTGDDLEPAPIPEIVITVSADARGGFLLKPDDAGMHGDQIRIEAQGGQPNIGFWDRADEWVTWRLKVERPGTFVVSASTATVHAEAAYVVELAGEQLVGLAPQTGSWGEFRTTDLGEVEIEDPGEVTLTVRARDAETWRAVNLRSVTLTRVDASPYAPGPGKYPRFAGKEERAGVTYGQAPGFTLPRTILFSVSPDELLASGREWRDLGIGAFFVTGVPGDWSADIWSVDGEPWTIGASDETFQGMCRAAELCRELGCELFPTMSFGRFFDWFDDLAWPRIEDQFRQFGLFARASGCTGVAIDIEYVYPQYHFAWDGYTYAGYDRTALVETIRGRMTGVARALYDAFPEAVLLTFPEQGLSLGGLVHAAWIEEAARRDAPGGIHLCTEYTYRRPNIDYVFGHAWLCNHVMAMRLSADARRYWQEHCSLSAGLWPLGEDADDYHGAEPSASELRQAFAASLMISQRYNWTRVLPFL